MVVCPEDETLDGQTMTEAYVGPGKMINSGRFDEMPNQQALDEIAAYLEQNKLGKRAISFRLRDWGISRQRYWGAPIPMIHCDDCGIVPVPETDLPVILPEDVDMLAGGKSPLPDLDDFVNVKCPGISNVTAARDLTQTCLTRMRWTIGCRLTSISVESSMLFCTCCIHGFTRGYYMMKALLNSRSRLPTC